MFQRDAVLIWDPGVWEYRCSPWVLMENLGLSTFQPQEGFLEKGVVFHFSASGSQNYALNTPLEGEMGRAGRLSTGSGHLSRQFCCALADVHGLSTYPKGNSLQGSVCSVTMGFLLFLSLDSGFTALRVAVL